MKEPVDGTAQVVGGSLPPDSAKSANVDLNLVVQAGVVSQLNQVGVGQVGSEQEFEREKARILGQ